MDSASPVLNFALLGCGRIAQKHAEIIHKSLPGARLVAVCDIKKDRADKYAEKYGVPAFYDLHDMMKAMGDDIDVVNVLTPTGYHAKNVVDLAAYGCHIVVEKPMALTVEDAEAMITACESANVRLFVVKQNRYNKPVQKLYEAVQANRFGKIVLGAVRVRWCRHQAYYDQDAWRGTWLLDGGVFANQASHHVDLLTWLMGDVESVFAYTTRRLVNIEAEDTGVAVLRFRSGAVATMEATTATRPKDLEGSVSILGEHGVVEIGGFAVNEITLWQFDKPESGDDLILTAHNQNPPNVYGFGHLAFLEHVVDVVKHGGPVMVDGEEGLKSLKLINAFYESAATGKEVRMDFEVQHNRLGQRQRRRKTDSIESKDFLDKDAIQRYRRPRARKATTEAVDAAPLLEPAPDLARST